MVCSTGGMPATAIAQANSAWILLGGAVGILACFFAVSVVLLALVLVRHNRRRRAPEPELNIADLNPDEAVDEPPRPPVP
jgi:membrane protein implicated in regulation of membrane protease activity